MQNNPKLEFVSVVYQPVRAELTPQSHGQLGPCPAPVGTLPLRQFGIRILDARLDCVDYADSWILVCVLRTLGLGQFGIRILDAWLDCVEYSDSRIWGCLS